MDGIYKRMDIDESFMSSTAATAVALCKEGKGVLRVNGQPIGLTEPRILAFKVYEPVRAVSLKPRLYIYLVAHISSFSFVM